MWGDACASAQHLRQPLVMAGLLQWESDESVAVGQLWCCSCWGPASSLHLMLASCPNEAGRRVAHLLRRLRLVQGAIPDSVAATTGLRLAEAAKRDIAGNVLVRAL